MKRNLNIFLFFLTLVPVLGFAQAEFNSYYPNSSLNTMPMACSGNLISKVPFNAKTYLEIGLINDTRSHDWAIKIALPHSTLASLTNKGIKIYYRIDHQKTEKLLSKVGALIDLSSSLNSTFFTRDNFDN